jgi:hypothetical protein
MYQIEPGMFIGSLFIFPLLKKGVLIDKIGGKDCGMKGCRRRYLLEDRYLERENEKNIKKSNHVNSISSWIHDGARNRGC